MRFGVGIALVGALVGIGYLVSHGLPAAWGQEEGKTSAEPPAPAPPPTLIGVDRIWNFHFYGKKRRGDFIELVRLDDKENRGRVLVITHLELRMRQSTRVQIVEHRKDDRKKQPDGRPFWSKTVRRGDGFSTGWLDSTSQWVASSYSTLVGMKFDPGTRPSVEVTQGSGDIWVYAEGYWSQPQP